MSINWGMTIALWLIVLLLVITLAWGAWSLYRRLRRR
jgi:hypothetical protein